MVEIKPLSILEVDDCNKLTMMLTQLKSHSKLFGGLVLGVGTGVALYYNRKKLLQLMYV